MNALVSLRENVLRRRGQYQDEDQEEQTLVRQAVNAALTPLRIATSRPAVKAYLTTLLFLFTSFILLSISTTAYWLFYYNYIPQIGLSQIIYLQYDANVHPHASIAIDTSALITQQPYDIFISLQMPRTPSNMAAGNFMLDLSLMPDMTLSTGPLSYLLNTTANPSTTTPLARSRRPAIMPYNSYVTSLSHRLLHLPVHLLSLKDVDATELKVPMFEKLSFPRGRTNIPTYAYLEVQGQTPPTGCPPSSQPAIGLHLISASAPAAATTLQIYSAQLHFHARFEGLRFYVYNYRILSFLIFSSLFYTSAVVSTAVAWAFITAVLSARNPDSTMFNTNKRGKGKVKSDDSTSDGRSPLIKKEDEGKALTDIKAEDDSDVDLPLGPDALENLSSTERTYPTLGRNALPLRYTPSTTAAPSDDAETAWTVQREDVTHDAEDEDDEDETRGRIITPISTQEPTVKDEDEDEPFRGDSGIGTSMESEAMASGSGIVRRRSRGGSRGSGSRR